MYKLLIIGSGGFVGAILRYLVSGWVQDWSASIAFPYGTLAVNPFASGGVPEARINMTNPEVVTLTGTIARTPGR